MDELMTIEDLSHYLSVPIHTIYFWTCKKSIPFIKISRRMVRFRRTDIDAWIESKAWEPLQSGYGGPNPGPTPPKKRRAGKNNHYINKIVDQVKKEIL